MDTVTITYYIRNRKLDEWQLIDHTEIPKSSLDFICSCIDFHNPRPEYILHMRETGKISSYLIKITDIPRYCCRDVGVDGSGSYSE